MSDFELVWDTRCQVAESPVYDPATHRLFFADINGKRINALSVETGAHQSWDFPEVVGSLGLCRSGRLVVAQRLHVVLFDPKSGTISNLTQKIDEPPTSRFNDGKVGPDGAFWVGTIDGNSPRQPSAALYRVTPDGQIAKAQGGYQNSNGLAWSPNGRIMYHSDTGPGIIEAWDFNPTNGARSQHRILIKLTNEQGRPDGAATDMDGNYWSAGPSAGCINCISPAGELLRTIPFPVPGPTMPCFAGDTLYVTTLRDGKSAEVLADHPTLGGLFKTAALAIGAPVGLFAD